MLNEIVTTYEGPKLRILLAGAGAYVGTLPVYPGCSKVLDSIFMPYSAQAVREYIVSNYPGDIETLEEKWPAAVSHEMVEVLHQCNCQRMGLILPVTVTAALETNRPRKGENQAYIAIGAPNAVQVWHLQLTKLEADKHNQEAAILKRYVGDRIVSEVTLSLATGITSTLKEELKVGGYLVQL